MNFIQKAIAKLHNAIKRYDDGHNFTCDVCGREVFGNERVCEACMRSLPFNKGAVCPFCGRKVKEAGVCIECKQKPLAVEKARSVFTHEGEAAALVRGFKRGKRYLYRTFAELCLPLLNEFPDCDLITCVPMTKRAVKKRTYNQSTLLAEELARRSGIPFAETAEKKRETAQQKTLGRQERERNLEGCFRVVDRAAVTGKTILIADDALTTGATVSELASVLKRAGAKRVFAITVTSVENKNPYGIPQSGKPR